MAAVSMAVSAHYSEAMPAAFETTDESTLVSRAKRGDTRAFEVLYRSSVDQIYALCLRMTSNPSEAEDCVQEAFIQAWKQLERFRGDSAFATWMHRIAVNAVLGRMRKSKREQQRLEVVAEQAETQPLASKEGELSDLSAAIDRLPEGARHVFVLYAVYGYSHDEAGSLLGIATGTSKAQLHRARRLLAQQLEQDGYSQ